MTSTPSLASTTRTAAALALATCVTSIALPAAAQQAGANPPARGARMVDETELQVALWTPDPAGGYVLRINGVVYGVTSDQDAIRVEVKQGGRTIAQTRCPLNQRDEDAARLRCETSPEQTLTATGDVSVDLVYDDDVAGTREVIRTLNLRVNRYPYWIRTENNRPVMGARYQVSGDDLLGTAFVYRRHPSLRQTEAHEEQNMTFYTAFAGTFRGGASTSMRCSVDGQRLPSDIRGSLSPFAEVEVEEWLGPSVPQRRLAWYRARFTTQTLWWGRRVSLPPSGTGYNTREHTFLGEHPGTWSCDLRVDGNTLRTFRFNVTPDGMVAPHAEQQGPNAMRLLPGTSLVDVRLPNPDAVDTIVNPAAIRAASQYGRRWANAEAVREMLGALPPAVGSSEPSRGGGGAATPAGGRGRGRRR